MLATLATSPTARRARASARRRSRSSARSPRWARSSPGSSGRPLHGRTVAVTRARAQASPLAARLRELGASVVEAPAIRTAARGASCPTSPATTCSSSPRPTAREPAARRSCRDARALAGSRIAAIGPGTARALREHGRRARRRAGARRRRGAGRGARDVPVTRALLAARRRRAATSCPTRCASAAPRSTSSPSTRRSPSRSTTTPASPRAGADYLPSPRPRPSASSRRRPARRRCERPAPRLDRPGHHRRAARARPRARPRGRPAHARRPRRRARQRALTRAGAGRRQRWRTLTTSSTENVSQAAGSPRRLARAEPAGALRGAAVGEGVGVDAAAGAALQPVVADRLGGPDRLVDVARVELVEHRVRPDARVAVGLQLEPHRQRVRLAGLLALEAPDLVARARSRAARGGRPRGRSRRPSEVARRAELALHVAEEAQVEVDALVARAVERADRGAGRAAGRATPLAVEVERGRRGSRPASATRSAGRCRRRTRVKSRRSRLGVLAAPGCRGRPAHARRRRRRSARRTRRPRRAEQLERDEHEHADEPEATRDAPSARRARGCPARRSCCRRCGPAASASRTAYPRRAEWRHGAPGHLPLRLRARPTSSSASCTAVIARTVPGGAGDRPRPRRAAPGRARPARACSRARCPTRPPASTSRSSTRRSARAGARSRCARRRRSGCSSGPTTGCCSPAAERFGGVVEAVEISPSPWRLEPVSATFHGRDVFAPVAARLAAGEPLGGGGRAARARRARRAGAQPRARWRRAAWSRTWSRATASATSRSTRGHADLTGTDAPARRSDRGALSPAAARRRRSRARSPTCAGRAAALRGRRRRARARRQRRRRGRAARRAARATSCAWSAA